MSVTWGQVNFVSSHYKSMGKTSNPSFSEDTCQISPILSASCLLRPLLMAQVQIWISGRCKGHLRSPEVTNNLLPITFDRDEIETRKWHQCVCLIESHRLVCNMTHRYLLRSPCDLDLKSNFEIDLPRSWCMCFDAPWREKYDGIKINALSFIAEKNIRNKKRFPRQQPFWPLMTSGASTIDLSSNVTEKRYWSRERFKSYLLIFRFLPSYHCSRDIEGFLDQAT